MRGFLRHFFSFSGRVTRKDFWKVIAVDLILFFAAIFFIKSVLAHNAYYGAGITIFWTVSVFCIWSHIAISAKRLHSLNWSGGWAILPYACAIGLRALYGNEEGGLVAVVGGGLGLISVVALGTFRGAAKAVATTSHPAGPA